MSERPETINISTVTLLKVVFIGLSLWLMWLIRDVLLIFLISVIIASAIDPVADFLQKRRVPRALSVLFVYAVFLGLVVLVGFLIVPPLTDQFNQIKNANVYQTFTSKVGVFRESLSHSSIGRSIDNSFKEFIDNFNFGSTLFVTTRGVLTGIVSVITTLVISFYLTIEENGMKNFVKNLTPYKHHAYVLRLVNKIQYKMGAWVLGQMILSAVIFGLVFIGLTVLKVKYALVLALVAGLLEVVPIIGPFISGAFAVFFAFLQAPALALAVLILWIVTQQLESHIIVPIVMSKSVGINPVTVILGVLIGGTLGGVVGILIAIPVISGISVFVNDIIEGQIGESEGSF
jgi:predicted PurR-regulated permease PerM